MNAIKKFVMGLAVACAAVAARAANVEGGDEVVTNGYDTIHIFTNTASASELTVNMPNVVADILIVGGGGAGASIIGGGGGGGGVVYLQNQTLAAGAYAITVGAGGAKPKKAQANLADSRGGNGGDSSFEGGPLAWIGKGGGGGGYYTNAAGSAGGCGGGGNGSGAGGASNQETYDGAGHGNAGAAATGATSRGGGGGGAGSAASGQNGGDGFECGIVGTNAWYGAGGGGGTGSNTSGRGVGGKGGGGSGGRNQAASVVEAKVKPSFYGAGGGGGDGAKTGAASSTGDAGYQGVVIVRCHSSIEAQAVQALVDAPSVSYDGKPHSVTLIVTSPVGGENCTTNWTWDGGSGAVVPAFTEPGVHTNVVRVSSPGLDDFCATTTVTIAAIDFENDAIFAKIPACVPTGSAIRPTPAVTNAATGLEISADDYDYVYPTDCITQGVHTVRIVSKNGHAVGSGETTFVIFGGTAVVAAKGDDETGDGTEERPYKTIGFALGLARRAFDGGYEGDSEIRIGIGTYAEKGLLLDFPVTVIGEGDARGATAAEGVYVNIATDGSGDSVSSQEFIFKVDQSSAVLENVRIHTAPAGSNRCGNNLWLASGTVRRCNVTGGSLDSRNVRMTGGLLEDTWISGGGHVNTQWPGVANNLYLQGGVATRLKISGGSGGSSVHLYNDAVLENSLITGFNRHESLSGQKGNGYGHVVFAEGDSRVVNCTIVTNRAVAAADKAARSAVRATGSSKIVNCVIYGNLNGAGEDSAFLEWDDSSVAANFVNCAFGEDLAPAAGTACIDTVTDAAFKDYVNGDYRPAKGDSVLKRAGTTWAEYLTYGGSETDTDLDGNSRKTGKFLDIGCYAAKVGFLLFVQ